MERADCFAPHGRRRLLNYALAEQMDVARTEEFIVDAWFCAFGKRMAADHEYLPEVVLSGEQPLPVGYCAPDGTGADFLDVRILYQDGFVRQAP